MNVRACVNRLELTPGHDRTVVALHSFFPTPTHLCLIGDHKGGCNGKNIVLSTSPVLARGNVIGFITGTTGNYRFSFDIVPTGTVAKWSSILHFNNGGKDCCDLGNRSPGFWFIPGTTRLHCRIGDSTDGNWGIDTDALTLNKRTKVTLECNGADVKLTVGATVYTAKQPTHSVAAKYFFYLIVYFAIYREMRI